MGCARLRALWETFLDGELSSPETLELQTHLAACPECAEGVALSRAIRRSTQKVVQDDGLVSEAFRARLNRALRKEALLEREAPLPLRPRRQRWRLSDAQRLGLVALSSAAAVALWMQHDKPSRELAAAPAPRSDDSAIQPDEALDRLIDYHTAPPPPQVTEPRLLPVLERDVGVRVRLPSLAQYGAEWQGGSVINLRHNRAAYLRFRTPDAHNVTVYMYDPTRVPLHAVLKPRMVREEPVPVYEDFRRGFSIAAQVRHGVGYAVATDLALPVSAEMVRAISTSAVAH